MEQIKSISILVRENHILETILVHVYETKAGVATVVIDNLRSRRQSERKLDPRFLLRRPTENGLLLVVADQNLTATVLVDVPTPDATIMTRSAGEYRLA